MTIDDTKAYSAFAVKDLAEARKFYADTLGLTVSSVAESMPLMQLKLNGGKRPTLVYEKEDHEPATYTILNFPVAGLEGVVDELAAKGIEFERYDGFEQDEKGIAHPPEPGMGPPIAWFTDPSGNILAVHEDI